MCAYASQFPYLKFSGKAKCKQSITLATNELKIIAIILSDRIWNMVNIIRMALLYRLYRKLKEIILGLELIQRKECNRWYASLKCMLIGFFLTENSQSDYLNTNVFFLALLNMNRMTNKQEINPLLNVYNVKENPFTVIL